MKIISVDDINAIKTASKIITAGGLVVYPTDTLYGFGVDSRNLSAINKINEIKKRNSPISIICWSINVFSKWVEISKENLIEAKKYLNESSTIILPVKKNIVHSTILGPNETLGIRMPQYQFPINLCSELNLPITTTSVNETGSEPLNNPALIIDKFGGKIDLIIDAGILPKSRGSKIYKLENSKFIIIRS
tara:strand:+ start:4738 stop:5310 length:573 start_codon:yes stop_codon:yes gene_type:complete